MVASTTLRGILAKMLRSLVQEFVLKVNIRGLKRQPF
jgi:hypothetical protein